MELAVTAAAREQVEVEAVIGEPVALPGGGTVTVLCACGGTVTVAVEDEEVPLR